MTDKTDEPFETRVVEAEEPEGGRLFVREHSPLYGLLSKIPARVHRGVMGYDLREHTHLTSANLFNFLTFNVFICY